MYTINDLNLNYTENCVNNIISDIFEEYDEIKLDTIKKDKPLLIASFETLTQKNVKDFTKTMSQLIQNLEQTANNNSENKKTLEVIIRKLQVFSFLVAETPIQTMLRRQYYTKAETSGFYMFQDKKGYLLTSIDLFETCKNMSGVFLDLVAKTSKNFIPK